MRGLGVRERHSNIVTSGFKFCPSAGLCFNYLALYMHVARQSFLQRSMQLRLPIDDELRIRP